jgi:hypothetical protein
MSIAGLIGICLILCLIAVLPCWPYSKRWGDGPAYLVAALLFIFFYSLIVGNSADD